MFFDFATRYHNSIEEISSPEKFSLSEDDYDLFKAFIQEKEFEFKTASEKAFAELEHLAKREKYYSLAEGEFAALEEKLIHNNLKDLETFEKEIRQVLREEIVGRYYFRAGRIVAQTRDDLQLDKALEIVNTPGMLTGVLAGEQGALARAGNASVVN
jgi:carboxyl-terminal processing protease